MTDNHWERRDAVQHEQEVIMDSVGIGENIEKLGTKHFSSCGGPIEPCKNLTFQDLEDAKACYKAYAIRVGFDIKVSHTRLPQSDKLLIAVDYACSREGNPKKSNQQKHLKSKKNQTNIRIGCKAMMSVSLQRDTGKWVVIKFTIDHNHELYTPRTTSLLRGHRKIMPAQKNLINVLNEAGIAPRKIMSVLSHGSGGEVNVGCSLVDVQNHLGSTRRELLKDGDAQRMYNYFMECQSKNPGFVYSIQLDENNRMGNCFWADARSRLAYKYFGDVVTFDATYLTNRYSMPFVPFTGVNHHHQSVMFGCALLVDETTSSYVWLLKTWLASMFGRAPSVIITDEDKSMRAAILEVLPETSHRLCMWHILQKVPEYLGHVFNKYASFQEDFYHCIHDTITIEEFEYEWDEMILKYELQENEWLKKKYGQREQWIPAYLRTIFCAGMSTTQRSESMNKFFKGFVRSSTLVSDFVLQYEKALDARYLKEKEKDLKTKNTKPILKTCYKMEADAANLYTRKLFVIFQEELFSSQKYMASKHSQDGTKKIYHILPTGREKPIYEVVLDIVDKNVVCSCHKFEFVGILCRHILAIFVKKSLINCLPKEYVLQRWTMNAKSQSIHEDSGEMIFEEPQITSTLRRNSLMIKFLEIVEEGQRSQKKHDHLALALQKVHSELLDMDDENEISQTHCDFISEEQSEQSCRVLSSMPFSLLDPPHVSSKGRPKSLRQKHPMENQVGKKKKLFCV